MKNKDISCWIITEGMIGTQNQCVGVTEALSVEAVVKTISLKQPWKTLSPWLGFEMACTFDPKIEPKWPDLLITAGRKSVAASRFIKKQSGGKTFTVQLQDPKTSPDQFDLVAVPFHDPLRGENVIVTDGAPNRLTAKKLNEARQEFAPLFAESPAPRVAVLIGGNSRTHKMTASIMHKLVVDLKKLIENHHASLMITASRRTGDENLKILAEGLAGTNAYIWDGQGSNTGNNPYFGILGWADHILVTSDSVSMLSDAGTTGKTVHMIPLDGGSPRFTRLYTHLQEINVMRPFDGNLQHWTYEPMNDAVMVAKRITTAMQKMYG